MKNILITILYLFVLVNFSLATDAQQQHTHQTETHENSKNCESVECQTQKSEISEDDHSHQPEISSDHEHQQNEVTDNQTHSHEDNDADSNHLHENTELNHEMEHEHETENNEHEHNSEIKNLRTIKLKPQTYIKTIHTTGIINVNPTGEIVISAQGSGIVNYSDHDIVQGTKVKKDMILFNISGKNIMDNNIDIEFIQAKNNYQQSLENYNRAKSLITENIISRKEFLQRKASFQSDSTKYSILNKNYKSKSLEIKSPDNGKIFELLVKNGEYVNSGDKLAVISKSSKSYLQIDIPKKYFSKVSTINSGKFRPEYCSKIYSFDHHEKLSTTNRTTVGNPYIQMIFSLEHSSDLLPGSFAEVWLDVEKSPNSLVIPKSAIIEQQGLKFVFVKHGEEDYLKTPIIVESMNADHAKIVSGIGFGDEVVVNGVMELKLSQSSTKVDPHAGHNH